MVSFEAHSKSPPKISIILPFLSSYPLSPSPPPPPPFLVLLMVHFLPFFASTYSLTLSRAYSYFGFGPSMNLGIWYIYLFHALPLFDHVSSSKFTPSYPSLTLHNFFYLLCDYTLTIHPSSLPSCCISSFITSIVYCLLSTVCCHNPRVSLPSPNHHLNPNPTQKSFLVLIEFPLL